MNSAEPRISITLRERRLFPSIVHATTVAKVPCLWRKTKRFSIPPSRNFPWWTYESVPAENEDLGTSDIALDLLPVDFDNLIPYAYLTKHPESHILASLYSGYNRI
jgi:hypothetical protein